MLGAVQSLDVEVGVQHARERDEARCRKHGLAADPTERREERGVDEQVELRVEVAPERRDAPREPRELTVGVVEDGLQLHEERREQKPPLRELDRRDDACRTRRGRNERRRHPKGHQRQHDEMRERPEQPLADDLVSDLRLA